MKRRVSASLVALCFAFGSVYAARQEATPVPKAEAKSQTASAEIAPASVEPVAIELKNKSNFDLPATARNPFWPIGWKPVAKVADPSSAEHAAGDIPVSAFLVTSITIENSGRFAIINGKIMQEGQQFGLQLGNQTYQITVKSVRDGNVVLARRDQEIVVPLRRKESIKEVH